MDKSKHCCIKSNFRTNLPHVHISSFEFHNNVLIESLFCILLAQNSYNFHIFLKAFSLKVSLKISKCYLKIILQIQFLGHLLHS